MTEEYPRNVVPLKDDALRILSHSASLALFLAALERPVGPDELARVTGRTRDEAQKRAEELAMAGLLRVEEGKYVAQMRHVRERQLDAGGKLAFRMGLLGVAIAALEDAKRAFRMRGDRAKAGIAMVTLPDRPDVLSRAVSILCEAEDQLRALAEEAGDAQEKVRIMMFTASLAPPDYFANTPQ